jgi:hypothetical protein
MKAKLCVVSLTIAALSTGCATHATQMYPGPMLPRDETARISADHASIVSIDGMALPAGRAFMLRAGVHALSATGTDANGHSIGLMTLCLAAQGGANYEVRLGGIARGVPEIYDLDRGSVVGTLLLRVGEDCAQRGNSLVAVALPSGARARRGVPPRSPWDQPHVAGPFSWLMLTFPLWLPYGVLCAFVGGGRC